MTPTYTPPAEWVAEVHALAELVGAEHESTLTLFRHFDEFTVAS